MKNIQHFVITKFNLKIPGGFSTDKSGVETRSDDWLNHRFDLFEKYCLPSLAAQKNKDFLWLLFFDESTNAECRRRIEKAKEMCPQIRAFFIDGFDMMPSISGLIGHDCEILITTRIDNDDAFRDDALEVIRGYSQGLQHDLCVNLRFGFSYDGTYAEVFSQKYNPFSSLIEFRKPEGFKTIIGLNHGKIHQLAKVKQVKTGPHWLMVVHDRNVANRMPDDYRHYSLWKWRRLRRYVKKYLLHKLRRMFWPADFKKKYKIEELAPHFHVKPD